MATRQYIGARYVIKIYENSQNAGSADWEANVNYEPLTMVTYQYGSYLSKKQVPATVGNPVDNPTYWVQTGFYNGQIANLQEQINAINDLLPTIEGDIEDAKDDINELKSVIGDRKFILIGDSLAYGISPAESVGSDTGIGWIKNFINTVGLTNDVYYADVSVMTGVAGFASSLTFLSMLQSLDTAITNKGEITDIVVLGGSNDVSGNGVTSAAIENAIGTFMNYCKTNYPNAKVKIGVLSARIRLMHEDNAHPITSYRTCTKHGAEFVGDGIGLYCLPDKKDPDHTHLSQAGYAYYTPWVNNLILSGHCTFHFQFTMNATLDTTKVNIYDSLTTSVSFLVDYSNEVVIIKPINNRYNAFILELLDRSMVSDNTIAECITLTDWLDLPGQYSMAGGGDVSIKNLTTDESASGGTIRVFTVDYTKMSLQLSPPASNRHSNDSNYKTLATITPMLAGVNTY